MKEALETPYNKCIFRETFTDEQSVRRNGGVPTAVTYFNGRANYNAATSTPLTLFGVSTNDTSGFDGRMMRCQVYNGILDLEQLTQIWSSTRGKIE